MMGGGVKSANVEVYRSRFRCSASNSRRNLLHILPDYACRDRCRVSVMAGRMDRCRLSLRRQ